MIVVAAKFTGKPENKDDILRLATGMVGPSTAEKGCISYLFYEQQPSNNQFFFFEEWESQAALEAHFQTSHFAEFMKQLPALIQGAPHVRIYDTSGFRDL